MKDLVIAAKVPAKDDKPEMNASITVKTGETAEESIKMFGGDAVNSNAQSNWIVTLQSNIRSGLKKGETQEQIQTRLGASKMGIAASKAAIDPEQAFLAKYAAATPEERKVMRKKLEEAAAK